MRLEFLLDRLLQQLPHEIYLTSGNVRQVKRFLEANWQDVTAVYDRESKAAELYYKKYWATAGMLLRWISAGQGVGR